MCPLSQLRFRNPGFRWLTCPSCTSTLETALHCSLPACRSVASLASTSSCIAPRRRHAPPVRRKELHPLARNWTPRDLAPFQDTTPLPAVSVSRITRIIHGKPSSTPRSRPLTPPQKPRMASSRSPNPGEHHSCRSPIRSYRPYLATRHRAASPSPVFSPSFSS